MLAKAAAAATAAAAAAGASAKEEWAKREPTFRAEVLSRAGALQPMLEQARAQMDEKARAVMDDPARFISENPAAVTDVILPALCAIDFPGAALLNKAVKLVGVAEMAGPLVTLISASGSLAKPPGRAP